MAPFQDADCPITRNYAESGPCGKLFRDWYMCRDEKLAPKLFQDWLHCLEEHDQEEQLDSFFLSPLSSDDNNTTETSSSSIDNNTSSLLLQVNNRVRAAWETFIDVDLANLQAFPFPDSLRPRIEWTDTGKITILFRNDSTHGLVAIFVQSMNHDATTANTTKNNTTRQLLAAAAPHNLLGRRILSFQLSPSALESISSLQVSAVFETDFVASPSTANGGEPRPLEVLCTLQVVNPYIMDYNNTEEETTEKESAANDKRDQIDNEREEIHAVVDQHLQIGPISAPASQR